MRKRSMNRSIRGLLVTKLEGPGNVYSPQRKGPCVAANLLAAGAAFRMAHDSSSRTLALGHVPGPATAAKNRLGLIA
jgi:hypothetical protein